MNAHDLSWFVFWTAAAVTGALAVLVGCRRWEEADGGFICLAGCGAIGVLVSLGPAAYYAARVLGIPA